MLLRFHVHRPHFFAKRPTAAIGELVASVGILEFAVAAVALFEPIYLYTLGFSLGEIMGFYAIVYLAYAFVVPLGARFLGRFGYERTILIASLFYICYYLALFSIPANDAFLIIAALLFAGQKTFYWPAFHYDFVRNVNRGDEGREFSAIWAVAQAMGIIGPVAGGVLIALFGFQPLFIVVALLILASNLPLFYSHERVERQSVPYGSTWRLLHRPEHRRSALSVIGFGEELIAMTLWPVFLYVFFTGALGVGALVSLATLTTALLTLVIGRLTDHQGRPQTIISVSAPVLAVVWLLRTFIVTPLQFFVSLAFGSLFKNAVFVPFAASVYSRAESDGQIAVPLAFEQVLAFVKAGTALLLVALFPVVSPFVAAFAIAGTLALFYAFHR